MNSKYEKYYHSRFYKYFSMLVEESKKMKAADVTLLFFQTPLSQNILGLSDFEKERLTNWEFDFNHISEEDCKIIQEVYQDNIDIDYLRQLYDGSKVYENNGIKYLADFNSTYVNIVSGKRITLGQPEKYKNRIYVYGQCTTRGTGVEDGETIPSYLQQLVNQHKSNSFRVENCATGCGSDLYDDIMHMKMERFKSGDVVILCTNLEIVPTELFDENEIPYYDCSFLFNRPHHFGEWFTDTTFHTNKIGNQQIARYIYEELDKQNLWNRAYTEEKYLESENEGEDIVQYGEEMEEYLEFLRKHRKNGEKIGSIVMNCNPFTKGHQYLIEKAASSVDYLYIFVVEEDKSFFPFADRMELVKKGTAHLDNVIVIPSGKFIISAVTFPGYFYKDDNQNVQIDTSMDIKIFGQYIAPELGISIRFAGNEPTDLVTRQYNETMQEQLPRYGIRFEVVQRKEENKRAISASLVRKYLNEKRFDKIKPLVPETTYNYLINRFGETDDR